MSCKSVPAKVTVCLVETLLVTLSRRDEAQTLRNKSTGVMCASEWENGGLDRAMIDQLGTGIACRPGS